MTIRPKAQTNASVEVTDFFAGGTRKREEMLAQPECSCSESRCMSDCLDTGCGPDPNGSKTTAHYVDLSNELDSGNKSGE
jgi:hypothetical protein